MPAAIVEQKISEIEKCLNELKAANGEILIKVADGLPQMIEMATEKVKL